MKEILILSDGSTDNTRKKVQEMKQKDARIRFIHDDDRRGKSFRLNQLYARCKTDYLLTIDGDVVFEGMDALETMIEGLEKNPTKSVAAARQKPVADSMTFIAHVLYTNYEMWNNLINIVNTGKNFYTLTGSACLLRTSFAKHISYPTRGTCDQGYLYLSALKKNAYMYVNDAVILQRPVATIHDFHLSYSRSYKEREELLDAFPTVDFDQIYAIPVDQKIFSLLQMFWRNPFYTICAVILNVVIKKNPYHDRLRRQGMWLPVISTKKGIV